MVSGFLTSPCDQVRMSSAVARPMRSSSKTLTSSKGSYFLRMPVRAGRLVPAEWRCCKGCGRPAGPGEGAGGRSASDLVDGARGVRAAREVDAQLLGGAVHLVVVLPHVDGHAVGGQHLHVQAEGLHLLEEHLEGLRDARVGDVLTLDDGLVHLHAARDVV